MLPSPLSGLRVRKLSATVDSPDQSAYEIPVDDARFDGTRFDGSARLRINGRAAIDESAAAREGLPGAKRIVRVTADNIFTNCPRYIPEMSGEEPSVYVPRDGYTPPEPAWKSRAFIQDLFNGESEC